MTVKLLHHTIRKRGGYYDDVDLSSVLHTLSPKLWIFDLCAVFMFLLKTERYACSLLQLRLSETSMYGFDGYYTCFEFM